MKYNPTSLRILSVTSGVLASICLIDAAATAMAQDLSTTIVADQVRSQGFPCNNPSAAERIGSESAPNHTVYLLKCEGITYRVVLIPDQGAQVTKAG